MQKLLFHSVKTISIILVLAAVSIAITGGCKKSDNKIFPVAQQVDNGPLLLAAINAERENNSLTALTESSELHFVAQEYVDLLKTNPPEFYTDNADGLTIEERLDNAGFTYITAFQAGFVIEQTTADAAFLALMATFSANVLDSEFTHVGIGLADWD